MAKKMLEFEAKIQRMDRLAEEGVQVETAHWEPRSILYYMGRNVRHAEDGSFSSSNQPMSKLIQRISQVTEALLQRRDIVTPTCVTVGWEKCY